MKKVILFFAVAVVFASCAQKANEEAPAVDSSAIVVEEVVDSTVVDSAAVVDTTVVAQ